MSKPKRSLESAGISDSQYLQIMERVAKQNYKDWGLPNSDAALIQALNDNTYDYRGYYNKYPSSRANASTHWTDEFKTVYHPAAQLDMLPDLREDRNQKKDGGIHIAPSKRGTFTAAATKHGMGVQEFASRILRNKDSYSPLMVKKANFARNASKWNR